MARRISIAPRADCPDCYTPLYFEILPPIGQLVICPICESGLEVIHRAPLLLDWAPEIKFYRRYDELEGWVYTLDDREDHIDLSDAEDLWTVEYLDDDADKNDLDDDDSGFPI